MKKSLGQNFLRDPKILRKIADFAGIESTDTVVEIGPGEGTLTKILLEKSSRVIAVEKDEFLAEKLKEKFKENILDNRLQIVVDDILDYKLPSNGYKLIGNIPYYITGAIFEQFLASDNQPRSITFVVQKEVAERIMAKNGKESVLSLSVKAYGKPEYGGTIKAGSFYPAPKVDSGLIKISNINNDKFRDIPEEKFFQLIKKGFSHKRKLLIKNLDLPLTVFQGLNIPPKIRAEDLSIGQWFDILRTCQREKLSPFS